MTEDMGASDKSDRALSASPTEPMPVSAPAGVTIPSAGQLYRSQPYAMTTIDTGRDADGAPLAEIWTFATEDDGVLGYGWLEVRVHEIVPTNASGWLAVYYRQWFSPEGEPAWGTRPKRVVGSLGSLKALIRRRKMTAQGMSAEGENSRSEVEGEARQPGPKDAPKPGRCQRASHHARGSARPLERGQIHRRL